MKKSIVYNGLGFPVAMYTFTVDYFTEVYIYIISGRLLYAPC